MDAAVNDELLAGMYSMTRLSGGVDSASFLAQMPNLPMEWACERAEGASHGGVQVGAAAGRAC
eukprot:6791338-Alexandrium_andersonii.AAC.1